MVRRRNPVEPGEFEDPLSNYDPPQYEDELERVLCEDEISHMQITPVSCVEMHTTVQDVLDMMVRRDVSCVIVCNDDGKAVGVFTARDVLNKIADNPASRPRPISELMTPDPQVVYATDCPAKALNLMAVGGFRHIPVLDVNDRVVGILGPRRITEYLDAHMMS